LFSELDNFRERIEDLRGSVSEMVSGMPPEALNWRPVQGKEEEVTNSLAVLAAHVAGAEHFWISEVIGGRPATRNRAAEFETVAASANDLQELLSRCAQETGEVLANLRDSDLDGSRLVEGHTVPVRWALMHVVDHTALHLGHMQITRQLWYGGESLPSRMWHQRLSRRAEGEQDHAPT
jgi:uncharacterized damage-inducible protein DinB